MSYLYNQKSQKDLRRILRKAEPFTERLLWSKLRNRQLLGFKFKRQFEIESYVVDFCCPEFKLVIELDGDSHFQGLLQKQNDKIRQTTIENLGFNFLRFTNKEVEENIEGVLEVIANNLKNNLTLPLLWKGEEYGEHLVLEN